MCPAVYRKNKLNHFHIIINYFSKNKSIKCVCVCVFVGVPVEIGQDGFRTGKYE